MFDAKQLLDQLIQNTGGIQNAIQAKGKGGLLDNPAVTGALSGVGGGLLAGLLLNNKKVRKIGGKVAAYGGAAALGAIAITAFRNWQANKGQAPSATQTPPMIANEQQAAAALEFDHLPKQQLDQHSRAMLAAMIAAAKSDNEFDERERQMIREQVSKIGDQEAVEWVQAEIRKPLDIQQLASMASTPEMAAELYLVSLVMVDEQNEHEKVYLNTLGEALKLEPPLRQEIAQQLKFSNEAVPLEF